MKKIPAVLVLTLLASALSAAPQVAGGTSAPALFAEASSPPVPEVGLDEVSIRRRAVDLDLDLLLNTSARTDGRGIVELNLFPDLSLTARLDRVETAYGGGLIRKGTLLGEPGSDVLFSMLDDAVFASITTDDRLYRVAYAGNGVHWVTEVDSERFEPCGTDDSLAVHTASDHDDDDRAGIQGTPDIMVMVVYSTAAKNTVGGTNAMNSKINLAITETNQSYANSLVDQDLVLVHTEEMVGYSEPSSFSQILSDLKSKTDGDMDNVHALRDLHAADAVSMICKNSQYCGIAYLMTSVSHSFESYAFSVVNYSCATGYYSFGHELGHNFGSAHDRDNAGGAAYSHSYGYRTPNNAYRTVMAYSPGSRKKYFSSPLVTYNGYVMGTTTEDNARSLNRTADTVAGWRGDPPADPEADFSAAPTSGLEDLVVAFTDSSTGTGVSAWDWDFGDTGSSALRNPTHTYVDPGTYTVSLSVTGTNGTDTMTKDNYIVVIDAPDAGFTYYNGSGHNPFIFTSTNLPVLGASWVTEIDGGSVGAAGLTFVVAYSAPFAFMTGIGELLVDVSSTWMMTHISGGGSGISTHTILLPNDPALAGAHAYTQGLLNNVGGAALLTNAIDALLGS